MKLKTIAIITALALVACLFDAAIVHAKSKPPTEDREVWVGSEAKYEITKDIEIEFGQELRYYKERSILSDYITDVGVGFDVADFLNWSLGYRFRMMPDDNEQRSEFVTNFNFEIDFGKFEIDYRFRVHQKYRRGKDNLNYIRNKITPNYKLTDWAKLYISSELFYKFLYDEGDRFNQIRYTAGAEFEIAKHYEVELYYMHEREFNVSKPEYTNVLGLMVKFNF